MAPEGAIHHAASLRSAAVVVVEVLMMVMRQMIRLCTWNHTNRERNGSHRSQNESEFSHWITPT